MHVDPEPARPGRHRDRRAVVGAVRRRRRYPLLVVVDDRALARAGQAMAVRRTIRSSPPGIAFPVVALSALLLVRLCGRRAAFDAAAEAGAADRGHRRAMVVARALPRRRRAPEFATANEIRIPAGVPVELVLTLGRRDPQLLGAELAGKLDMIPGRREPLVDRARRARASTAASAPSSAAARTR